MMKVGDFLKTWGGMVILGINTLVALGCTTSMFWVKDAIRVNGDDIKKSVQAQLEAIRAEFRNYATRAEIEELKGAVSRRVTQQESDQQWRSHRDWSDKAIENLNFKIDALSLNLNSKFDEQVRRTSRIENLVDKMVGPK